MRWAWPAPWTCWPGRPRPRGADDRATVPLGAAQTTWLTIGEPQAGAPELVASHEASEAAVRRALGDRAFDEAFKRGMDYEVDQAVDYALAR